VENNKVTGKYSETVKSGFETDYPDLYNFNFEYKQSDSNSMFTYMNPKGKQENGQLHPSNSGKIYLDLQVQKMGDNSYSSNSRPNFDQEFNRVFQD
jgi:hypothetical protein